MDDRNESTHERLNRELARAKFYDVSYWGGWGLLIGLFGLFGFLHLNTPSEVRFVTGIAGASMPLVSESGQVMLTRVEVDGGTFDLRTRSQILHPSEGDVVCLRAGKHRFTGHTTYVFVSDIQCDGANATERVD